MIILLFALLNFAVEFEKIGADKNHVHVLCSAAPRYAPSRLYG